MDELVKVELGSAELGRVGLGSAELTEVEVVVGLDIAGIGEAEPVISSANTLATTKTAMSDQ